MTEEAAAPARILDGRFELLDTLGRGGMGVVYRALDRERDVEVAIKTVKGITADSVLRFKSEFRALRDLRHPNLVELGELIESDGTWFFTMELVRGVSFLEWARAQPTDVDSTRSSITIDDEGTTAIDAPSAVVQRATTARFERKIGPSCDATRLRGALAGLARGLSALHAAGMVHRDVKPSNILVEPSGRVVLLDFGVVSELAQAPEKLLVGTVKYMAPEQARGDAVGPGADWYAVGVLLFQALTGQLPFAGVSPDEMLVLKQHVRAPAPAELVDNVPVDLDQLCQRLLERDVAMRPTESDIVDVLGIDVDDDSGWWAAPANEGQLFVGRHRELRMLDDALAASRDGPICVIVEGESGVGKTALVHRFIELARTLEPRLVALRGRCHERERVPFNAMDGVVDDLARFLMTRRDAALGRLVPDDTAQLLAVFPALRAVSVFADVAGPREPHRDDVRDRAFAALRALLTKLGRRRSIVLAIDDLQWADDDSTALLGELLRVGGPPVCLIATKRAAEGEAVIRRLSAATGIQRVALGGLAAADAEELVRLVVAERTAHIVSESRGHPLFLRELVRHADSPRLEQAIWSRVTRLEPGARQLLAAIAVAGSPIPRHVAFAVAGLAMGDADGYVTALARDHLVRPHGPRPQDVIEPFHDRVREAVTAHLPVADQRALHRALAQALEAAGAPADTLLSRFESAGDHERASRYLIAAAETALAAFAFGRAVELFRRALLASDLPLHRRSGLLVSLAEALSNDGRTGEAAERYSEAAHLEPAGSDRQLDLLRRAAERFLMAGRLDAGLDAARAVLGRTNITLPTTRTRTLMGIVWNQLRMRGDALVWSPRATPDPRALHADICWSLGAGLGMVDSLLGAYFSGRAARLALDHGNPLQIARAMGAATVGAALLGRTERARQLLDAARRAADEDATSDAAWYVTLGRTGTEFLLVNDFASAATSAAALERDWYAAGHGPGWETDVAMHFSLASQQMLGDYSEVTRRVARFVHEARRKGNLFQEVTLRVRFAIRHLIADQPQAGRDDVADALASWLPGSDSFGNQRAWGLWSLTRIALYAGQLDTLERELDGEWRQMQRSLVGRLPLMRLEWYHAYGTYLLGLAIAARKRGRPSEARPLVRRAERIADRLAGFEFPAAPTSEMYLRAAIAWFHGGDARAEIARRAIDESNKHGVYVFTPFLERRLGEVLGGSEGAELIARGDAAARRAGFVDPERAAEMVVPTGRYS